MKLIFFFLVGQKFCTFFEKNSICYEFSKPFVNKAYICIHSSVHTILLHLFCSTKFFFFLADNTLLVWNLISRLNFRSHEWLMMSDNFLLERLFHAPPVPEKHKPYLSDKFNRYTTQRIVFEVFVIFFLNLVC